MRIAINAFPLRRDGGGARYAFAGLLSALLRVEGEHRYLVFVHLEGLQLVYGILKSLGETMGGTGPDPRVRVIHIRDEAQIFPYRFDFDLYFGPLNNLNPRLYDHPTVAILHDIQEQYFPENFSKSELVGRREAYPDICRSATTLVTISEFCKQSFVEKFGIDPAKIEVVYNAPQAQLVQRGGAGDDGHWSREPLPKDFLFYPANFYRHKNHAALLDAVQRLRETGPERWWPHVVFSGYQVPGGFPLRREIAARGLKDCCHVFTELTADELRYLYRHALAAVLPTTFEGFCIPAVEAAALGCPVVCSDLPVLREVLGDHALYFGAGAPEELSRQIRRVRDEVGLRERLVEGAASAAARFTWDDSARRMVQIFAETRDRFSWGPHKPGSVRRPRIGVLVHLPRGFHDDVVRTVESLLVCGYPDLALRCHVRPDLHPETRRFLESAGVECIESGVAPAKTESTDGEAGAAGESNGAATEKTAGANGAAASGAATNGAAVATAPAGRAHGYEALRSFAQERHLQLVGEVVEGSRFKITGLDSLAWCHLTAPDKSVYLGEAMEWRGERYTGVARMRLTGDLLWKLDGFLHPEIMFINAPALAAWPEGERRALEAGDEWRWELLRAARQHGHVLLSHRTLADCDTQWGVRSGLRAGMFDYYSAATERTVKVRLLRRVEPAVKRAARILPMKWQDAGTRLWYHIAR